jgi:hypothetical protein
VSILKVDKKERERGAERVVVTADLISRARPGVASR